jgi:alkylation response protein AidB-like acyl-CoA dehydrogenase
MKFSFDVDQLAFRDAVRDVLTKDCPPEAVRASNRVAWDALAEMGVFGVLVSESAGGMALDEQWLVLLLEEAGYAGLPQPIVETAAVAMPLVADRVETGAMISTDLAGPIVAYASAADHLLLADGATAMVLVAGADAVIEDLPTVDQRRHAGRVAWDADLAVGVSGDRDLAFDRGAWGTSAFLVGLTRRMLDMTVEYVKHREQFGVPIGSFQAVKHHLANIGLRLTFARPAVYRASWSLATNTPTRSRDVSIAKSLASDAALYATRYALQCHGAIGYTEEADLQLYMKRTWALARAWGDAPWHRNRIGQTLGV